MTSRTLIHFIDSLGLGGAEVLLSNTLPLLPQYEHVLITLQPPYDQLSALAPRLKAHHTLNVFHRRQWPGAVLRLRGLIKRHKPCLVHLHSQVTGLLGKVACPKKIPLFYTLHTQYGPGAFAENRTALLAEQLTARPYHHLIGVTKVVLQDYQQHVPRSGTGDVLHNMVGSDFFDAKRPAEYVPGSPLRCVSVGNLKAIKNHQYMLDAFCQLKDVPVTLDIFGDGPDREDVEAMIRKKQLSRVNLRGSDPHLSETLPCFDTYITASRYEGFGIALVEAMATGLPALVSDIPVFREVAGDSAMYFDLNDPTSLANMLRAIYEGRYPLMLYSQKAKAAALAVSAPGKYINTLLAIYNKYTT